MSNLKIITTSRLIKNVGFYGKNQVLRLCQKIKVFKIKATQISMTTENNCYERKLKSANLLSEYGWGEHVY